MSARPFDELSLIDSLPALIWVSGPDHGGTYFNRTWLEFTGRTMEQEQGDGWMEGVHPGDRAVLAQCASAFELRRPFRIEFRLKRRDGEYRWMLDHGEPRFLPNGAFAGFIGSCLDITDRRVAEERQSFLMAELDHRVRNTLASIRAMLRLSAGSATSVEALADSLEGRINAYAKAHGVLAAQRWEGARLEPLISGVLEPYVDGATQVVELTGPDLILQPAAALSLGLVIHELATNAAKHGALSAPQGHLRVTWRLRNDSLEFVWQEAGGPPVSEPLRGGFGSFLIGSLPKDMGGAGRTEFLPSGVRWRAELRAERTLAHIPGLRGEEPAAPPGAPDIADAGGIRNARILVAEDDPLIALDLARALHEAGAAIVGPLGDVAGALSAADAQALDGAVLDVNLRGELVVPVAQRLRERRVPFLLMTGYAHGALPAELTGAPLLQKPASPAAVLGRLAELMRASGRLGAALPHPTDR